MASDKLKFVLLYSRLILEFSITQLVQKFKAIAHKYTYRAVPSPLNVVVIGGSFTGLQLARRLSESLPTGYRVVLVEKNSHFNWSFNFPRYSVLRGHEQSAFIPYDGVKKNAPKGIFEQVKELGVAVYGNEVELGSGERLKFEYLAIATGSKQPFPAKVLSSRKDKGARELRGMQDKVRDSRKIALVGGGAVGVQLATDIKSYYPEKEVTLVHSREQLLPSFGMRLHEYVKGRLDDMGVKLRLGERARLAPAGVAEKATALMFKNGGDEEFDLVIPCTGQTPNSAIVSNLGPDALAPSGRIKVKPTLQLSDPAHSHMFALGDVAETSGAKMARAGMVQAEVVMSNILTMIKGREASKKYVPRFVEGALKLSLGKAESVMYVMESRDKDILIPAKSKSGDLDIAHAWQHMGPDPKDFSV